MASGGGARGRAPVVAAVSTEHICSPGFSKAAPPAPRGDGLPLCRVGRDRRHAMPRSRDGRGRASSPPFFSGERKKERTGMLGALPSHRRTDRRPLSARAPRRLERLPAPRRSSERPPAAAPPPLFLPSFRDGPSSQINLGLKPLLLFVSPSALTLGTRSSATPPTRSTRATVARSTSRSPTRPARATRSSTRARRSTPPATMRP